MTVSMRSIGLFWPLSAHCIDPQEGQLARFSVLEAGSACEQFGHRRHIASSSSAPPFEHSTRLILYLRPPAKNVFPGASSVMAVAAGRTKSRVVFPLRFVLSCAAGSIPCAASDGSLSSLRMVWRVTPVSGNA